MGSDQQWVGGGARGAGKSKAGPGFPPLWCFLFPAPWVWPDYGEQAASFLNSAALKGGDSVKKENEPSSSQRSE